MRINIDGKEYIIDAPTAIARLVSNAYESNGFIGFVITGPPGAGKTVLALWSLYFLFEDWDLVFRHVVFDWQDHFSKLEEWVNANIGKSEDDIQRFAALVYDDAAVQFNKYIFYADKALAWSLSQYLQLVRRFTASVIFTCVDEEELLRSIRSQPFLYVEVSQIKEGVSLAKFYQPTKRPLGKRKTRIIASFVFTPRIPDTIYQRYVDLNLSYVQRSPLLAKAREIIQRFKQKIESGDLKEENSAYVEDI